MARTAASRVKSVDLGHAFGTSQRGLALSNGVCIGYRPQDGLMGRTRTAAAELASHGELPPSDSADAATMRQASLALETEPPSSQLNRRVSRQLSSTLGLPSAQELAKAHPHLSNLGRPRKSPSGSRASSQKKVQPSHQTNAMAPILSGVPMPSDSASPSSHPATPSASSHAASPEGPQILSPHSSPPAPGAAEAGAMRSKREVPEGRRGVRFQATAAGFDGPSSDHPAGPTEAAAAPASSAQLADLREDRQPKPPSSLNQGSSAVDQPSPFARAPASVNRDQQQQQQQHPDGTLHRQQRRQLSGSIDILSLHSPFIENSRPRPPTLPTHVEQQPQQQSGRPAPSLLSHEAGLQTHQQLPQPLPQQQLAQQLQQQAESIAAPEAGLQPPQQQQQLVPLQLPQHSQQQLDPIGTLREGRISGDSPHPANAQPPSIADPPLDSHPVTDPLSQQGLALPRHHPSAAPHEPLPSGAAAQAGREAGLRDLGIAATQTQSPIGTSGLASEPASDTTLHDSLPSNTAEETPQPASNIASESGVLDESVGGGASPGRRRPQRIPTPQVLQQLPSDRELSHVTPLATLAEQSEDGDPSITDGESLAAGTPPEGSTHSAGSRGHSQHGPTVTQISPFQGQSPPAEYESVGVSSSRSEPDPHEPKPIPSPHIVQLPTPFAAAPLPVGRDSFEEMPHHFTAPNGIPMGTLENDRSQDAQVGTMPHLLRTLVPYQTGSGWHGASGPQKGVIIVPANFEPKEGTKLTEQLLIGKYVGGGKQGGIYSLHRPNGHPSNSVLKVMYKQSLANFAGMADVEREWEVGRRLNFLAEADGSLPGFMGVGAAIKTDKGVCRGMVLQRLHGRNVDKVVHPATFIDIDYIHDMLLSVFVALDKAQGALGFHHQDFRLENIMEMLPEGSTPTSPQGSRPSRGNSSRSAHSDSGALSEDSSVDEIDPRQRFKIIDYGLGVFDENYAAGPDLVISEDIETMPAMERQPSHAPAFGCMPSFPFPTLSSSQVQGLPKFSLIERMYRFYWRRKGDVYHLLFNLGEWLDGRVWLKKDRLDVQRLLDLIHHVTGAKLQAYFVEANEAGLPRMGGCGFLKQNGRVLHFARRWSVRLQTWTHPNNPGLTAAEALTSNFFTKRTSCRMVVEKQRTFEKRS
ncbi:hypothetical protein WJX74_006685 [Apatococcus lobatus]|uniref:Protein kinase domain-containing protein n=1 Tax=Apatococcus lobatus TaxID=904363 RepID=A0AAW1QMC7_9CHLO